LSARRFDALLIDFYGTICAGDRLAVETICRRIVETYCLSVTPQELAGRWGCRFFDTVDASNHDSFQTLYQCEAASLCATMADFSIEIDPAPFVAELERYWADPPIYADAVEFLNRLDLPVCCVSNADTKPLLAAIGKHALRFNAVVTSEMARCYKPRPEIFHKALDTLHVSPERALHVGDSLHSDIAGAAGAGIGTAWLRREDRIHDIGTYQPEFVVHSLYVIPSLIGL
jgi:2-haloacid dehalogenase/putative hydrolase of the HAD superfamily